MRWPARYGCRLLGVAACAAVAASCTSSAGPGTASGGSQPGSAAYRCDGGQALRIENRRTSVTVVKADGARIELPASPPGSRARYGEPPYALVLDGREALYFETGKTPLTCRR